MSSTFDTMQQAVRWLADHKGQEPDRARQVAYYLRMAIDQLHDLHHQGMQELNVVAGHQIACLDIVLREDDPEDRQLHLEARMNLGRMRNAEDEQA